MYSLLSAIVVFSLLFDLSHGTTDSLWTSWKLQHKKTYNSNIEEEMRRGIWNSNFKLIEQHNSNNHSYTLALNHLADLTNEEFQKTYLAEPLQMENWKANRDEPVDMHIPILDLKDVADSVDWRNYGYVSSVKNQGGCGSCWAFSATGALEAQYVKRKGTLIDLSEQELLDCSWRYGNVGCSGGLMDYAFAYVRDYGICSGNSYPYVEYASNYCKASSCTKIMRCKGFKNIKSGYESQLQEATASVGPISVAIDASRYSFQFYSKGTFYSSNCSSSRLNHGVLVVGYGTDNYGQDYWIVKNSWGSGWGQKGYVYMSRNANNNCGIATAASYPVVNN